VLKNTFLVFFNNGLPEVNSRKLPNLLDLKSLRSFGGTSLHRLKACFATRFQLWEVLV